MPGFLWNVICLDIWTLFLLMGMTRYFQTQINLPGRGAKEQI